MFALEVESLVKRYGNGRFRAPVEALRGVDLTVERGTAFGLIGPNGAGKTTLLKAVLGVIRPSAGRVRVFGRDPEDAGVRRRVGYLPERLHLMPAWKPLAYLESIARLKGLSDTRQRAETQLERVGLASARGRRIATFSKGMRQRLGLAAALLGEPELIVLDEPTDGIDPKGRAEVRTILQDERRRGATLFLNSHLLTETERICDQVGILVGGKVRQRGSMAELCASSTRWRMRFKPGVDHDALQALGIMAAPEPAVYVCDGCDAEALNVKLAEAQRVGATLIELHADARNLEDLLLELLDGRHD